MAATRTDIERWLKNGKAEGATHLIVVTDTFDWDDYPVYVMPGQNARTRAAEMHGKEMQRVTEVYSISKDWEEQLNQKRVFNYD